jgi:hypothetical protein
MKQLFINGEATTLFFDESSSFEFILGWVKKRVGSLGENIFNLSEQHSCSASGDEDGEILIRGDEDSLTITIETITPIKDTEKETLTPKDFKAQPMGSVLQKSEYETIARNIMVILERTGDKWRELSWEEYSKERTIDGDFNSGEESFFKGVVGYTVSSSKALLFCKNWNK